jgi:hypothetical protein
VGFSARPVIGIVEVAVGVLMALVGAMVEPGEQVVAS